jgi:hypothetical protein
MPDFGWDLIVKVPFRAFGRLGAQEFTQLEFQSRRACPELVERGRLK